MACKNNCPCSLDSMVTIVFLVNAAPRRGAKSAATSTDTCAASTSPSRISSGRVRQTWRESFCRSSASTGYAVRCSQDLAPPMVAAVAVRDSGAATSERPVVRATGRTGYTAGLLPPLPLLPLPIRTLSWSGRNARHRWCTVLKTVLQ